eukprot:310159-Chlamydomonas_euryale.AAC.1
MPSGSQPLTPHTPYLGLNAVWRPASQHPTPPTLASMPFGSSRHSAMMPRYSPACALSPFEGDLKVGGGGGTDGRGGLWP